ncbi:MAG TPA: hypothetical protein DHV12_03290, partial [Thermotogae bacterium]|nr:hypothetical protein [Thermotogota bacterium]
SSYFFLEVIVCECLRGEKRSTSVKALCWNIFFHSEYNLKTEMCDIFFNDFSNTLVIKESVTQMDMKIPSFKEKTLSGYLIKE